MKNSKIFAIVLSLILALVAVLPSMADSSTRTGSGVSSPATIQHEALMDGGFEMGSPNPFWNEFEATFGTPLCTAALCGTGLGTGPNNGEWWGWFGGVAAPTSGSLDQDYEQEGGVTMFSFWLEIPACSGSTDDWIEARINGTMVWRTDATDAACGTVGYVQHTIDITSFGAGMHNVEFFSDMTSGVVTNFFIDDVSIDTEEPSAVTLADSGVSVASMWLPLVLLSVAMLAIGTLQVRRQS